jgi:hypothetical protein
MYVCVDLQVDFRMAHRLGGGEEDAKGPLRAEHLRPHLSQTTVGEGVLVSLGKRTGVFVSWAGRPVLLTSSIGRVAACRPLTSASSSPAHSAGAKAEASERAFTP